jgi:hypothetical protein
MKEFTFGGGFPPTQQINLQPMPSCIRRGRSINVNIGLLSGSLHKSISVSCIGRRG